MKQNENARYILERKINRETMYYIVKDQDKKCILDWFVFKRHKDLPELEKHFFKILSLELKESFENSDYSKIKFRTNLLIGYNLTEDGLYLNIKNSRILFNFYSNLKFKELEDQINILKNKISKEGADKIFKNIMELTIQDLSLENQLLFKKIMEQIGPEAKEQNVLKEILYLCIYNIYENALNKIKKIDDFINYTIEIADKNKIDFYSEL